MPCLGSHHSASVLFLTIAIPINTKLSLQELTSRDLHNNTVSNNRQIHYLMNLLSQLGHGIRSVTLQCPTTAYYLFSLLLYRTLNSLSYIFHVFWERLTAVTAARIQSMAIGKQRCLYG